VIIGWAKKVLDKPQLFKIATRLVELTYTNSGKQLPALIEAHLSQLPGGDDWLHRRN
jgi:hypothetical protein